MRNTSGLLRGGPGRPVGTPNRATREVREFCLKLLSSDAYRTSFEERLRNGTLPAGERPEQGTDQTLALFIDEWITHVADERNMTATSPGPC